MALKAWALPNPTTAPYSYGAADARNQASALALHSTSNPIVPFTGVFNGGPNTAALCRITTGRTMAIAPFQAMVSDYLVTNTTETTIPIAAGGSTARTDAILLVVENTEAGDDENVARISLISGVNPNTFTPPNGRMMLLAYVAVAAGADTLTTSNITQRVTLIPTAGQALAVAGAMSGTDPVDFNRRAALGASLPNGTQWWDEINRIGGIVSQGQLSPTTPRLLHSQTAPGPFGIVGDGDTVLGTKEISLIGGPRLIRTTIGASIVPAGQYVNRISARIYALGDLLCSAQGRIGRPEDGERIILNATRDRVMSGAASFNVVALVEPNGTESNGTVRRTANLTDVFITVTDLGPAVL